MGESEARLAEERIDTVEKRLVALHDLGIDTAPLHSQLAFARTLVREGGEVDVTALCDEVAAAARRLAEGASAGSEAKSRSGRYTRDHIADSVRSVLNQGLLASLISEHQTQQKYQEERRQEERFTSLATRLQEQTAASLATIEQARVAAQEEISAMRSELEQAHTLLQQLRQVIGQPAAVAASAVDTHAQLNTLMNGFINHSSQQQEQFLNRLADGMAEIGRAALQVSAAPVPAPGPEATVSTAPAPEHSQMLVEVLRQGFNQIGEALLRRSVSESLQLHDDHESESEQEQEQEQEQEPQHEAESHREVQASDPAASAPPVQEGSVTAYAPALVGDQAPQSATEAGKPAQTADKPVSEHQTTADFQAISTRTERAKEAAQRGRQRRQVSTEQHAADQDELRKTIASVVNEQLHQEAAAPASSGHDSSQIKAIVAHELERLMPARTLTSTQSVPVLKEAELSRLLVCLLPSVLSEEPVRRALFSLVALEAVSHPGVLGELTGLRTFLRRELSLAAEELVGQGTHV